MELRKSFLQYRWLIIQILLCFIIFIVSLLFFNSIIISIALSMTALSLKPQIQKFNTSKLNKRRENEFMMFVYSLSSMLSVGKSFEHAFRESVIELAKEKNYYIILEDLRHVCMCFDINMSISESLKQLANMYKIESILNFSNIVELAILQGGSLEDIIDKTVTMIQERDEVEKELDVIITQKRFELIVMLSFVPLMIIYLRTVSGGFYAAMYGTVKGRIIMTICLGMYILSGYIGKKIVDIKV